jgi:ribosomal 30S subunit maturation factor RimM
MIYYTKYAEKKFDILNKYKVFITKEQVEDALKLPNKSEKKGEYYFAEKEGIRVVYKKESGLNKVITFYPIK